MATKIIHKEPPLPIEEVHPINQGPGFEPAEPKMRMAKMGRMSRMAMPMAMPMMMSAATADQYIYTIPHSIRPQVKVVLDAYGNPTLYAHDQKTVVQELTLGNQYEHKSLWIRFDLDQLLWNTTTATTTTATTGTIEGEPQYALYIFRLNFNNVSTGEMFSWEFNGKDFQIPKEITQKVGHYEMALSIQERRTGDSQEGNIPDDWTNDSCETFISKSWLGEIKSSLFKPELLENIEILTADATSQKTSLIKPPVDCYLSNDGFFALDEGIDAELGVRNDNYIRYLRFNPGNITTLINDFNTYAVFEQTGEYAVSVFEPTEGPNDDTERPLIAWIPTEVYDRSGDWNITIVSVSKSYTVEDPFNPSYVEEFARFISDAIVTTVKEGFVKDSALEQPEADANYFESNFITADERVMMSPDNSVFNNKNREVTK